MSSTRNPPSSSPHSPGARSSEGLDVSGVTAEGAAWLASAGTYPRSTLALWRERPDAPVVLLCGSAFDVVSASALFGRRMLDRLWDEGPGSGPVAAYRGRILLFAAPGTAQRLPSLMEWEEWGGRPGVGAGRCREVPPLLCHGTGDAVTVPPLTPGSDGPGAVRTDSRWLVAPDTQRPWLPGPEILLWAAVRAARAAASAAVRISIFPRADQDAKVYDVSRRR
ncbi:bifunctional DNA primase/polymerase [Streptomyces sp. NBC_00659]|uniref:bifunctional DNA primase/polymerase n=1 Tax=Streptomyces sp. NBC_00659 TaxID=2903669 RepID=UPI002E312E17|nr:bifunctional DNA primase/polymerase [Streptomyces sp. NBC_00659]